MSAEAREPRPLSPDPPNRRAAAVAFCGVRLQPVFFGNLLRSAALDATGSLGRRIGVFEITPLCQLFLHGEKSWQRGVISKTPMRRPSEPVASSAAERSRLPKNTG